MDTQLSFSQAQSLVGTASTASTTITAYDESGGNTNIGNIARFGADMGVSEGAIKPKIVVSAASAFTTSGISVNIQFQGSTDSSTWTTYIESGAIGAASLAAGATWVFDWPRKALGAAMPRYVRMFYTMTGGTLTSGTVNANVVLNADGWVGIADQYPANYVVGP
jgi:hypothetical protein